MRFHTMSQLRSPGRQILLGFLLSSMPVLWLEFVHLAAGSEYSWLGLGSRWVFVLAVLLFGQWVSPTPTGDSSDIWPWQGLLALGLLASIALPFAFNGATWAAWLLAGTIFAALLGLDTALTRTGSTPWRWSMRLLLVALAGLAPAALAQIEARFSEEEFFVALQVLALSVFWVLLRSARYILVRRQLEPTRSGLRLGRRPIGLALVLLALAGLVGTVLAYQSSFYPDKAPTYEGISAQTPFLCGEVAPDPATYDGRQVFEQLLAHIATNPNAGPPEYGMLALGTGEQHWAEAFRESILAEATAGRFTEPAGSVKWTQYEAALRAHYVPRVREAYPELFSDEELDLLADWFEAINERALAVEPIDWMYALAFSKRPEGPYENQENGAGLLALLEAGEASSAKESISNQDYLSRMQRGWTARFRNTDDAYIYQPEWINNALFQASYGGTFEPQNLEHSFEWLLLQALPDGTALRYNHPIEVSLAGISYLGALLLDDPRLIWLAGRAVLSSEAGGVQIYAQPGVERSTRTLGTSPTQGSCLIYGDSGLPNQIGPLAPDKIVFRDGWSEDATYLLLNLRFTGWHRYKATNTVTLLYNGAPLAADLLEGKSFSWLPEGRSLYRDKRIPRENLNGLLIPRSGLSAVLYSLTGIGGPWAQDPPYYAQVIAFEPGEELDRSHTRLTGWHKWQHDRWIYFFHDEGPIIIVDRATGPAQQQAAVAWHLVGDLTRQDGRMILDNGGVVTEMVLVPLDAEPGPVDIAHQELEGAPDSQVSYNSASAGQINLVTVFLPQSWAGAKLEIDPNSRRLSILKDGRELVLGLD